MKEHPILFTSDMVRAILDGRKTQTRRVVVIPENVDIQAVSKWHGGTYYGHGTKTGWVPLNPHGGIATKAFCNHHIDCPYGVPGDWLWVRETWQYGPKVTPGMRIAGNLALRHLVFLADCADGCHPPTWRPSIHMPRWASRILLEVTDVRVQRVQEISHDDAVAEGMGIFPKSMSAQKRFSELWDHINAKRGYPWQSNPWVWAITFKVVDIAKVGAA